MPPARTGRARALNNENDEISSQRVTRAKAAALSIPADGTLAAKKPLQAKKGVANAKATTTKRAALGDVSNVRNAEDRPAAADGKKTHLKTSSIGGIPKPSRTNSTRSVVPSKDGSALAPAGNDLKRPASQTNITTTKPAKRRQNSSASSRVSNLREEDEEEDENLAPSHSNLAKTVETITTTTTKPDGTVIKEQVKRESAAFDPTFERPVPTMSEALREQIEAMDDEDISDPLMVAEYAYEIFDYMKELELQTMPNADYMEHQPKLEWRMRGVLVDWLLEVHMRFHLLPETFYLTVSIIDRFLTHKQVELERLQLVGVTAMFIASKYEEVLSPHIQNFVHVADDGFSEAEILSAERYILTVLEYNLSYPNPMHFMRRISKADNYDIQTRTFAKYLLEISLLDHRLLQYRPSVNAAAAMHLARVILDSGRQWEPIFVHYSGYTEEEIRPAFDTMIDYLRSSVAHSAFYRKYAGKKFMKASLFCRSWAKSHAGEYIDDLE